MKCFLLPLITAVLTIAAPLAQATGLILPLYGNTTSQFTAAINAAKTVPVIAIINPDDGVGSKKDNFVAGKVSLLKSAGAKVGGYIATGYGSVSLTSVKAQMDKYTSWYGVAGFFLDEMSDSTGKLSYYQSIKTYAASKKQSIIGNPGTSAPSGYGNVTDVLITYEDPYSRGFKTYNQPSWTRNLAIGRTGAIVYSAAASNLTSIIDRAITQRYGWIYVTDKNEPDPFGSMASYFTSEVNYIKAKNK
jgi:hypothetical protein